MYDIITKYTAEANVCATCSTCAHESLSSLTRERSNMISWNTYNDVIEFKWTG